MFSLALDSSKCVRVLSKESICDGCSTVCPTSAITFSAETNLPSILPSACVNCGGCVGSCPTEALTLDFHNNTNFFFDFVQEEEPLLSCTKNVPCLAVLNTEHILALALLRDELVLDVGHCKTCEIKEPLYQTILDKVDEVNYILDATQSGKHVVLKEVSYQGDVAKTTDRRAFFDKLSLKEALRAKRDFDKHTDINPDEFLEHALDNIDIAQIRNKQFPDKRKILFTAIKRSKVPEVFHVIDATEISFTSVKTLDHESCTACQMCYRVCPTGALKSDGKNSKIDFDPFMCIKCHVCHDVCEPNAIALSDTYSLKQLYEPQAVRLATFNPKKCDECGAYFDYREGDKTCRRCKIEEDEAKELWGLA